MQVIAPDDKEHRRTAFYRPGYDFGYISSAAGVREVFPNPVGKVSMGAPFVLVGRVSDDTGPFESTRKLQVQAAGNTWTLHVPKETPVLDLAGKTISSVLRKSKQRVVTTRRLGPGVQGRGVAW